MGGLRNGLSVQTVASAGIGKTNPPLPRTLMTSTPGYPTNSRPEIAPLSSHRTAAIASPAASISGQYQRPETPLLAGDEPAEIQDATGGLGGWVASLMPAANCSDSSLDTLWVGPTDRGLPRLGTVTGYSPAWR